MPQDNYCKKCKREMAVIREESIADTRYKILKCGKCKTVIARAEN